MLHEQELAHSPRGLKAIRVPSLLYDRRYQLAASFASGMTALAAIRALRQPIGH
jgi:hypothetical protein